MTKLRWGILGVARINRRLIPALTHSYNSELRAIASRSLERAKAAAEAAQIPKAYGSYEELLADPEIDAIYIPLPNTLHAEWTMKAADHGKHVLCEKPLAPTAEEAQRVVDYCCAKNVKLMEGFMWPHHPRTARLQQFLDQGGIGQLQRFVGSFTFSMPDLQSSNIRLQANLAGGSLLDVGCYPIYASRWVFGTEPVRVYATAEYVRDVDVSMSGLLRFPQGRMASFDCGFISPLRQRVEITGTKGVVVIKDLWAPKSRAGFAIHCDGKDDEEIIVSEKDQIVQMVEDFGRSVLGNEPVIPPPEEAVKTLRVLDALARSAREDKEVRL